MSIEDVPHEDLVLGLPPVEVGDLITWSGRYSAYRVLGVDGVAILAEYHCPVVGAQAKAINPQNGVRQFNLAENLAYNFAWCDEDGAILSDWTLEGVRRQYLRRKILQLRRRYARHDAVAPPRYPRVKEGDLYTWGERYSVYKADEVGEDWVTGHYVGEVGGEWDEDESNQYYLAYDNEDQPLNFAWCDTELSISREFGVRPPRVKKVI